MIAKVMNRKELLIKLRPPNGLCSILKSSSANEVEGLEDFINMLASRKDRIVFKAIQMALNRHPSRIYKAQVRTK